MENCFFIVDKISKNKSKDKISLTYNQRLLRRKNLFQIMAQNFL